MARVEVLFTPAPKPDLPQCEAIRATPYANDTPDRDRRCKWSARYRIDGRLLCSKHAGPAALEILLKMEDQT